MSPRHVSQGHPTSLHHSIRSRTGKLSYLALALLVERLLRERGYVNIRLLGRRYSRGRTLPGGADLAASVSTGIGRTAILVQIRQHATPVARRSIDEMRGVIVRRGIPEGLLVTTGRFSRQAVSAALAFPGRPVLLLDGSGLADLMIEAGLGIAETRNLVNGERTQVVDEAAFQELENVARTILPIS